MVFNIQFAEYGSGFEGDWIESKWNGRVVRFTCVPVPDDSGTQVHDNSGNISTEEWFDQFVRSVSLNYYVAGDFVPSTEHLSLFLEAKEYGEE